VRGHDCEYPAPSATSRNAPQQPVAIAPASAPELRVITQLSATSSDPFDTLSIDMPYASPGLFNDCKCLVVVVSAELGVITSSANFKAQI
jgi:hypothetical protein